MRNKTGRGLAAQKKILSQLSRREAEVFCMIGCGHVPKRIALHLTINVKTVESFIERIRKKLTLSSGAELQHFATSFMRLVASRGVTGSEEVVLSTLLSFREHALIRRKPATRTGTGIA